MKSTDEGKKGIPTPKELNINELHSVNQLFFIQLLRSLAAIWALSRRFHLRLFIFNPSPILGEL
jgi:hypothetical protein